MMSKQTLFDRRVLVAAGLAAGLGLSQTALAETASDDLEITAGLTEALTLSCNAALSFGITRLGTLSRDDDTTLTVDPETGAISEDGGIEGVTAGSGQAGECTISGSNADESDTVTVTIAGEIGTVSLAADGEAFGDLESPDSALEDLDVGTFTTDPGTVEIEADGGATFNIGGTLTIPGNVGDDNLGGYSAEVTVEVDDGFVD